MGSWESGLQIFPLSLLGSLEKPLNLSLSVSPAGGIMLFSQRSYICECKDQIRQEIRKHFEKIQRVTHWKRHKGDSHLVQGFLCVNMSLEEKLNTGEREMDNIWKYK